MNDGGLTVTVPVQVVRGGGGGVLGGVAMFRVQKERCEVVLTTVMCFMVVKSQMWERVFIRQDRKGFFCEKVHVSCVVFVFVVCFVNCMRWVFIREKEERGKGPRVFASRNTRLGLVHTRHA